MELNGEDLLGRAVKLDFARERGAYTPQSGYSLSCSSVCKLLVQLFNVLIQSFLLLLNNFSKESSNSFQRGGQTHTAYVRGFDKYLGIDEVLLCCHINCSFRLYFIHTYFSSSVFL